MADLCLIHMPHDTTSISAKIQEATEQGHTDCVVVLHQLKDTLSGTLFEARLKAARQGHLGLLKYLYKTETSWLLSDLQGPLCEAMFHGHIHVMNFLIASGANADGQTPLILATKRKDVNMVKAVLYAGANVNTVNSKTCQTALLEALLNGCTQIAILLIEAGADVNIADKSGDSALIVAARNRYLNITKVLIEAGADVNKRCVDDTTALMYFALNGNQQGVRLLLRSGAKVNISRRRFGPLTSNIGLLMEAAGQMMVYYPKFPRSTYTLHHHCRLAIRRHLMELDQCENLFLRIPRLGLPCRLARYLLFDTSVDENDT